MDLLNYLTIIFYLLKPPFPLQKHIIITQL